MDDSKKLKIMVVEDEELLLQAVTKKLTVLGIEVLPYKSGKEAIDYLNKLQNLPDAIWLDYYLKDMSGLGVMELIKQNSALNKIPVVVVSNSASADKVQHMLALGASKYILKAEHRLDEIVEIINKLVADSKGDLK